ncbi:hypothetical protein CERSUDRAFT_116997 [Gelatoporia subvermispora B]|uniref:Uncharacterized protein n=1 Tax=Ceriporiopsis subvermispora (strain B) TaxID=914234 RepID=M2R803_CERS8|nr:hypothetical protein CERSUDRAFT_116997 [Gelatoporia subvermispora B]
MHVQELPPELWNHILDIHRDDKATLCACSLVCRDWLPTTRRHLFAAIALVISNESIRERDLQVISGSGSSSIIEQYCRHLSLWISHSNKDRGMLEVQDDTLGRTPTLPNVDSLALKAAMWTSLPSNVVDRHWRRVVERTPNITYLELAYLSFSQMDDLISMLLGFPHIRQLHLQHVIIAPLGRPWVPDDTPPDNLEAIARLQIDEVDVNITDCSPKVVKCLFQGCHGLRLRKLTCLTVLDDESCLETFQDIINRSAETLEELDLTTHISGTVPALSPDFRCCTKLRALCLKETLNEVLPPSLLQYIPTGSLEKLTIGLYIQCKRAGDKSTLQMPNLTTLDAVLTDLSKLIPSLAITLRILVLGPGAEDAQWYRNLDFFQGTTPEILGTWFPLLHEAAAGRVTVSFGRGKEHLGF